MDQVNTFLEDYSAKLSHVNLMIKMRRNWLSKMWQRQW